MLGIEQRFVTKYLYGSISLAILEQRKVHAMKYMAPKLYVKFISLIESLLFPLLEIIFFIKKKKKCVFPEGKEKFKRALKCRLSVIRPI